MTVPRRIGVLTPSSNTVLEPITTAILASLPDVTAHFGRFRVTEIALTDAALAQFDTEAVVTAARLLADARCDVIIWSGTSSGWLGFDADERLCREITRVTGIPACTSVLALNEVLSRIGARRLALVTPYRSDVQARIVAAYTQHGIDIVAERHFELQDNFSFSTVTEATISAAVREVAAASPDAVAIFCTNLRGAPAVPALERELGLPVFDTVATAVWQALPFCGRSPALLADWGSLFSIPALPA